MDPDIGDVVSPVIGLALDILQIPERSQWEEVVADVVNGAFLDLSLFMWSCHVAGNWDDFEGHKELEECFVKSYKRAITFYNSRNHIIMNKFFWCSVKEPKCIKKASV